MTYNMELLIIIPLSAKNLSLYFIRYYFEYIVINRFKFKALYLFSIFVNNVIVSSTFNLIRVV